MLDAHALWHCATPPSCWLWYRFVGGDLQHTAGRGQGAGTVLALSGGRVEAGAGGGFNVDSGGSGEGERSGEGEGGGQGGEGGVRGKGRTAGVARRVRAGASAPAAAAAVAGFRVGRCCFEPVFARTK